MDINNGKEEQTLYHRTTYNFKSLKQLLDEKLNHILEHLCPAYQLDDEGEFYIMRYESNETPSELSKKLSKDRANFEEWDNSGSEKDEN